MVNYFLKIFLLIHFILRIRPEQIQWSKEAQQYPLAVFNQPQSKDIIQGCLGNCWFISALSLIAEIPQILYKVMITKQYNPAGK
jgi:calpain-15